MMKKSRRFISLILAVLLLFGSISSLTISAGAEDTGISSFSAIPSDAEENDSIRGINWYQSTVDGNYYLFVPQSYDKSALRVSFTASGTVMCGSTELVSGSVTDVFASGEATLTCGSSTYHVIVLDGGDIGTVQITTESGSLYKVHHDKSYKDPGNIVVTDYDGTVQYDGVLDYLKGRGNSTWNAAKKPYNIKLAKKANLFGMGKAKKWCLLANAGDATMMRDLLGYKFAKDIGVDVTSDVVPVNLYINNDYMGAYVITEKVEIGENRVDIRNLESDTEALNEAKLDTYPLGGDQDSQDANSYQYADIPNSPEDITGGYLLELEKIYRYPPEVSGFITARKQAVVVKEPEYASQAEVEYIREYYQQYENAVYSQTGYNALGKYYTEYVDVESIARMYLAEEFGANFDGCSSSFYLYKDVDGKICAGPAWDFDLSFQQTHGINELLNITTTLDDVDSLYIQHCFINYDNSSYKSFLAQLFTHNDFQQVVQNVWNNVVKEIYDDYYASIDVTANRLHSTVIMNAIRWNTYGTTNAQSIISGYNKRLNVIKNYIPQRYAFLSTAYSDDTYFVKYDNGAYGKELTLDTTIYNSGDTAVVKECPPAKNEYCCAVWYLDTDYTQPVAPESEITVTDNTNLYAKWNQHVWKRSSLYDDWDQCELCGRYRNHEDGVLLESWSHSYHFSNGVMEPGQWEVDENGKKYYYINRYMLSTWRNIDGKWYFFGPDGYAYTGNRFIKNSQGVPEWFAFGEDGAMDAKERISDDGIYTYAGNYYYVVDGYAQLGLQLVDGDYYYFRDGSDAAPRAAAKNTAISINDSNSNGLLEKGIYYFGADGKMIRDDRIIGNKVYINGKQLPAYYGLVRVNGDFYYVAGNADIVRSKSQYITSPNGLTFDTGIAVPKSYYDFDADGKMIIPDGVVGDFFYIKGIKAAAYYGLVTDGENYYYVGANSRLVKDKTQYLTTTNGLTYSDGTVINKDYYYFDADGKMAIRGYLKGDYYYVNGKKVPAYYGLVKHNGDFYYIGDGARIIKNRSHFITSTNNLCYADGTMVPKSTYQFDENGKMVIPSGLVGDYYYVGGVKVPAYYGLIKVDGDFYYIGDGGRIIKNRTHYITTTNDLKYDNGQPVMKWNYDFGPDGKMVIPNGLIGDFYYVDGTRVNSYYGLVKHEGNFYYIADNARIVKNKTRYISTTNGLKYDNGQPVQKDTYEFDADGKMILPNGIKGNYYYIEGARVPSYYGLVKYQGDFYYIGSNCSIVKDKKQYLTTTNDLTFDNGDLVPHKTYYFDADGKMVY